MQQQKTRTEAFTKQQSLILLKNVCKITKLTHAHIFTSINTSYHPPSLYHELHFR